MSAQPRTGDQVVDAIEFAVYAKHLEPRPELAAGFPFWLDKCLDFDPAATLRWAHRQASSGRLLPAQRATLLGRLAVRPRLKRVAEKSGTMALLQGSTD